MQSFGDFCLSICPYSKGRLKEDTYPRMYYFSILGNIKDLGTFCTCAHYNNTMLHTIPYNVMLITQIIAIA